MARQRQQQPDLPIVSVPGDDSTLVSPIPKRYQQQVHPEVPTTFSCNLCRLGKKQDHRNSNEVGGGNGVESLTVCGAGPDDLSQVRLIVISDYPGAYESAPERAYPMFDNRLRPRESDIEARLNAGGIIRLALYEMFGLDTYTDCWFTNALRCNPAQHTAMETDLRCCSNNWGRVELEVLDKYVPNVPILIAGNLAFRSIKYLYPTEWKLVQSLGLNECRRRDDLLLGSHPLVVTMNPAVAARADTIIETRVGPTRGGFKITGGELLRPFVVGSPIWNLAKDLSYLGCFL